MALRAQTIEFFINIIETTLQLIQCTTKHNYAYTSLTL